MGVLSHRLPRTRGDNKPVPSLESDSSHHLQCRTPAPAIFQKRLFLGGLLPRLDLEIRSGKPHHGLKQPGRDRVVPDLSAGDPLRVSKHQFEPDPPYEAVQLENGFGIEVIPERLAEDHLPFGAHAVIGSGLNPGQIKLVNEVLDQLKQAGVTVLDQRDVDQKRYQKSLATWHEDVLDEVRSTVRELVSKRKRASKAENRDFFLIDDQLRISSASTEVELRDALRFLDRDDPAAMNEVFDEAMRRVPMPEVPKSLEDMPETEPLQLADLERPGHERPDAARFRDFT